MNTLSAQLYELLALGLGDESFQTFVDRYQEKYDEVQIDGFSFAPMTLDYTFQQLIASTKATTLPTYVDPESPAYETSLGEVRGISDMIPTQKKRYRLDRTIVRQKMLLVQKYGDSVMDGEMRGIFTGLLDEATDGLIGGYYNSLTHQRMQEVSTGGFEISLANNPRGISGIKIGFGIDADHFDELKTTARWWTNAEHTPANEGKDADPIQYIKDRVKYIRRIKHYLGPIHLEMSKDLYDDMLTHTAVVKRIGHYLQPTVESDDTVMAYAKNLEDQFPAIIERLTHVRIVPRDTYAFVDKPNRETGDLVTEQVENFKKENISFVPDGNLGTIQGVQPLTLGYEPENVATYNDGRLVLTQYAEPRTHSIYIDSEAAQICVPSDVRGMFISTVTV